MGLFDKSKNDKIVEEYKPKFDSYVDSLKSDAELNRAFMEITILRIRLDKKDNPLDNFRDKKERESHCDRMSLIKIQFIDVMKTNYKYNDKEYELIDNTMKRILPLEQKNWWIEFWKKVGELFDKATGRK